MLAHRLRVTGDARIAGHVAACFRLAGSFDPCGTFEPGDPEEVSQPLSREWLWENASGVRRKLTLSALMHTCEQDPLKEVVDCHLQGLLTLGELDAVLGKSWVPRRRFLVAQGDQVRAIDDLSKSFCQCSMYQRQGCSDQC